MQKNLLRLDKFWEPERPQRAAAPFEGTRLSRPAARRSRQTAWHCAQAFSPFAGATRCGISPALFPGEGASGRETSAPIRLRPGRAGGCRATFIALIAFALAPCADAGDRVVYEGKQGPGKGKHIVFLAGDEEYRSEEGMPMLAKILAVRQGFKCTVLFPINPADGTIDPNNQTNIVGLEALKNADMLVMLLRFRELPDAQMKYFVDYLNAGKPILAI